MPREILPYDQYKALQQMRQKQRLDTLKALDPTQDPLPAVPRMRSLPQAVEADPLAFSGYDAKPKDERYELDAGSRTLFMTPKARTRAFKRWNDAGWGGAYEHDADWSLLSRYRDSRDVPRSPYQKIPYDLFEKALDERGGANFVAPQGLPRSLAQGDDGQVAENARRFLLDIANHELLHRRQGAFAEGNLAANYLHKDATAELLRHHPEVAYALHNHRYHPKLIGVEGPAFLASDTAPGAYGLTDINDEMRQQFLLDTLRRISEQHTPEAARYVMQPDAPWLDDLVRRVEEEHDDYLAREGRAPKLMDLGHAAPQQRTPWAAVAEAARIVTAAAARAEANGDYQGADALLEGLRLASDSVNKVVLKDFLRATPADLTGLTNQETTEEGEGRTKWRRFLKTYHPDVNGGSKDATAAFQIVPLIKQALDAGVGDKYTVAQLKAANGIPQAPKPRTNPAGQQPQYADGYGFPCGKWSRSGPQEEWMGPPPPTRPVPREKPKQQVVLLRSRVWPMAYEAMHRPSAQGALLTELVKVTNLTQAQKETRKADLTRALAEAEKSRKGAEAVLSQLAGQKSPDAFTQANKIRKQRDDHLHAIAEWLTGRWLSDADAAPSGGV